jgi:hypothetical protein
MSKCIFSSKGTLETHSGYKKKRSYYKKTEVSSDFEVHSFVNEIDKSLAIKCFNVLNRSQLDFKTAENKLRKINAALAKEFTQINLSDIVTGFTDYRYIDDIKKEKKPCQMTVETISIDKIDGTKKIDLIDFENNQIIIYIKGLKVNKNGAISKSEASLSITPKIDISHDTDLYEKCCKYIESRKNIHLEIINTRDKFHNELKNAKSENWPFKINDIIQGFTEFNFNPKYNVCSAIGNCLMQIETYSVGVNSDYPSLYFHIRGRQLNDNGGRTNALAHYDGIYEF